MRCRTLARVSVLLAAAVALAVPSSGAATQPKKKLNVLFILADDMRRDTIAALGNTNIKTPYPDKLVKAGTAFTRAHIQGSLSGAVCMPSRAMIMTGRSLFKTPLDMKWQLLLGQLAP